MKFKKIIQLELNEISLDIIQRSLKLYDLPNFKKITENWSLHTTHSESKFENIEPWIQWVTAHTGKTLDEHGVFRLADSDSLKFPQIWESLSNRNIESAIIGCMNATRGKTEGGMFFPDPWAKNGTAFPDKLQPLWNFISERVQTHAVKQNSIRDLLSGLLASPSFGVPPSIFGKVGLQFFRQKFDPSKKWKLAALFDEFLASIFEDVLRKTNFGFNALFLNAIAHYQHHYWRQFDKDQFDKDIQCPDCGFGDDPITFGLKTYDRILGRILDQQRSTDTLILIATGLSQIPYIASEQEGGMHYYRLRNHKEFVASLGLRGIEVYPLMSRDWQISAQDSSLLEKAKTKLSLLKLGDQPLFSIHKNGNLSYFIETNVSRGKIGSEYLTGPDMSKNLKFSDVFQSIAVKSGYHSEKGFLWTSSDIGLPADLPLSELFNIPLQHLQSST